MNGYEKAKATAERLKADKEATKQLDMEKTQEVKRELAEMKSIQGLSVSGDVADFYKNNASVGAQNISQGTAPLLKVVEALTNLPDGVTAGQGDFIYTPTNEVFKDIEVSIMTISRGYYAPDVNGKPKFTQMVGGMILGNMKPFVMYITGTRLQNLWNFAKDISPFTRHKESPIPMFAFRVELTTELVKHAQGKSHLIHFKLNRNDNNQVQILTDMQALEVIRSGVEQVEQFIDGVISQKEIGKNGESLSNSTPVESIDNSDAYNALNDDEFVDDNPFNK